MRCLLPITLVACTAAAVAAKPGPKPVPVQPLEGKVTQVIDGATFVLEAADGKTGMIVRLAGIEPPESCQTWGKESHDALKDWLVGENVVIKSAGKDRRGRLTGKVLLDGADLGGRMVSEGHAFSARTKWDHGPYMKEERLAHSLARGMYSTGAHIELPADFRRTHAPCPAPAAGG